jgi:hypothetical protein
MLASLSSYPDVAQDTHRCAMEIHAQPSDSTDLIIQKIIVVLLLSDIAREGLPFSRFIRHLLPRQLYGTSSLNPRCPFNLTGTIFS